MTLDREHVVAVLRRDASLVWNAVIAVVFVCFGVLAIAATIIDLLALKH